MSRSSSKQIERDEKKLLEELSKNVNKSINDIAKKCGFSRQKVWRIIKNLEKNHTIWGYTAVINQQKLNKKRFIMLIRRSSAPIPKDFIEHIVTREIAKKFKKMGINFINSILLNGSYDWLISFTADDTIQAKKVVEMYYEIYKGLIKEIHLNEYLFTVRYDGIDNPELENFKEFFF